MSVDILQYGDLACALILVSLLPFVRPARRLPVPWRVAGALIFAILCLVEIHGVSLAGFVRGAIGDPAVTTTLLLLARLYTWAGGRSLVDDGDRRALFIGIAIAGVLLYPMALGLGRFDPYGLGYDSELPAILAAVLTGIALARSRAALAWLLVLPILAWDFSLLESDNLWNYFLDPLIVIYSLGWALRRGIGYWQAKRSGA
jgi:hypothetical protein